MLGDGVLVESIDLRRLRESAGGNDLLSNRFDRRPEASGEKNPGPLTRKGACNSTARATSGSVDYSILALKYHEISYCLGFRRSVWNTCSLWSYSMLFHW